MTDDREALVAWSALAEPADAAAGWLVDALGPAEALAWVREVDADPVSATHALLERHDPRRVDALIRASEPWRARLAGANPALHRERAGAIGARVVARGDLEWPEVLDDLGQARPFVLWVRGGGVLADVFRGSIAIVGARSATAYGQHVASSFAGGVSDAGRAVISGGAYGIDAAAHRAALTTATPTVAVMAGGVDRLYPLGNQDLLERILDAGAVVSEVPPGFAPHRSRFLTRNRLIACASVTCVVEAAWRSGALSTARHAAELARPVGAVPGPVTSASSAGCHALVRDGIATLVTSAADLLELAGPIEASGIAAGPDSGGPGARGDADWADPRHRAAYDAVGARGSSIEDVARIAGLTIRDAAGALAALELSGRVGRSGSRWIRAAPHSQQKTDKTV